MQSYHPVKFDGHMHCGGGDITVLVVEEQTFTCYHFILPLLFSSKAHCMSLFDTPNFRTLNSCLAVCPRNTCGTDHSCLKQFLC